MALDEDYLDDIASAFADVIDAKSPFTAGHSARVTLFADMIGEEMGLGDAHRRWLRRAALLHDIGKLGVSNDILDKPGRLDAEEWAVIRTHPGLSRQILERVPAFADLASVAGGHHERLDGRGYPGGLTADALCLETRILSVADVFDALSAERPYRAAMPIPKALGIMDEDAGAAFDPDCLAALKRGLERGGMAAHPVETSGSPVLDGREASSGLGVARRVPPPRVLLGKSRSWGSSVWGVVALRSQAGAGRPSSQRQRVVLQAMLARVTAARARAMPMVRMARPMRAFW